ncbi:hypothetical protein QQP08_027243 [Theobroma cacao]|nr:hypothetical protein QQP08_027243 [Theobroma cacao]
MRRSVLPDICVHDNYSIVMETACMIDQEAKRSRVVAVVLGFEGFSGVACSSSFKYTQWAGTCGCRFHTTKNVHMFVLHSKAMFSTKWS